MTVPLSLSIANLLLASLFILSVDNMNDNCLFSRDHVAECSERTVLSCLEPATVILNKEDYIKKCNDHLDSGPYIKLQKDPTVRIKREARTKLAILRDNGTIDQSLYFKLKPTDSQAPRFYGLSKIHKASIPVRPIVSYSGSPLFNLSKYIANILKPYTLLNKQHCKNSKEFSEFIRAHTIGEDETMVSFDVEALYTNVPIDDALAIIKELLENDEILPDRTPLSPKTYWTF